VLYGNELPVTAAAETSPKHMHHTVVSLGNFRPVCVNDSAAQCFAGACSVLYGDELKAALEANPKHMRLDIALSLEQQNAQGGPEYVQVGCACVAAALQFGERVVMCGSSHGLISLSLEQQNAQGGPEYVQVGART
jgi:hypothetical protein